jgi:hypothetical protein
MSDRRYTLKEIDAMREFFLERSRPDFSHYGVGPEGPEPAYIRAADAWRGAAEEELRTAMQAGVDPAECVIQQLGKEK